MQIQSDLLSLKSRFQDIQSDPSCRVPFKLGPAPSVVSPPNGLCAGTRLSGW
ncbi:hypothetical protein BKA80DRAFT_269207 [Phyllosticta citrichinensis]